MAVTHGFRHGVNGLQQETLTIFHRAAVFVGAGVQFATEELVKDESVCSHDFHAVKAGFHRRACGVHEVCSDAFHFMRFQRAWLAWYNRARFSGFGQRKNGGIDRLNGAR